MSMCGSLPWEVYHLEFVSRDAKDALQGGGPSHRRFQRFPQASFSFTASRCVDHKDCAVIEHLDYKHVLTTARFAGLLGVARCQFCRFLCLRTMEVCRRPNLDDCTPAVGFGVFLPRMIAGCCGF